MTEKKHKLERLTGVKGMNDILPSDTGLWEFFENTVKAILHAYGYQNIRTPILEHTPLFRRSIGEVTDIVEKEMYSFVDSLNGKQLTMRPENTAAVVRSAIEHNLLYDGPKRLWYIGPMFRHERPQRGRYRQFHQVGVEALGFVGPDIDAEIILICQRLWNNLGLRDIRLELNSLGHKHERAAHRDQLIIYLERYIKLLDHDSKNRLYTNPLRVLDTKNPALQDIAANAPKLIDFLGDESLAHFEGLQSLLSANNISFTINPRLVRGLDYYNMTVFEWVTNKLGAQGTIGGGGRYDLLIKQLGGKPALACGWALGIERILELLRENNLVLSNDGCDVYIVHQGETARIRAFSIAEQLRNIGLDVILHCSVDNASVSFKSQMKLANASGATYAIILGDNEVWQDEVSIKPLRGNREIMDNAQQRVPVKSLVDFLAKVIAIPQKKEGISYNHK
ncbi:histidine--tRNA ligase [Candidatus Vallotia tarda]|uniref:Histidine--tRNA ligase n=1 Tax=Candidatus Vallotiella hemipterorum TaxID=1177213 RepID=A0A916NV45_9BURK|nr:histidine--tRNA ligase [Candidatus Vallotia tarda]CAG7602786.1 Histidine--tRNA ligase [Candidatus Vallotia tarda]